MGWCFRAYVFHLFKDRKYDVTVLGARLSFFRRLAQEIISLSLLSDKFLRNSCSNAL